jgi:hypothetical protein
MNSRILENSIIVRASDQVSCDLGGESAILDVKAGIYYGLNAVGTRIWNLIQEPKRLKEVRDTLLEEYEVEPDRCERELSELLQELLAKGLIEIEDEEAS